MLAPPHPALQPLPDALLSTLVTTLASDDLRAVLLLAGGAGHTPLIQISQQPAPLASVAATVAGSGAGAEPAAVRQQLLGVVLNLVRAPSLFAVFTSYFVVCVSGLLGYNMGK